MTLEQLIDRYREAEHQYDTEDKDFDEYDRIYRKLLDARADLANYVIQRADELISWERQHVVRTSIRDDGEDMTW